MANGGLVFQKNERKKERQKRKKDCTRFQRLIWNCVFSEKQNFIITWQNISWFLVSWHIMTKTLDVGESVYGSEWIFWRSAPGRVSSLLYLFGLPALGGFTGRGVYCIAIFSDNLSWKIIINLHLKDDYDEFSKLFEIIGTRNHKDSRAILLYFGCKIGKIYLLSFKFIKQRKSTSYFLIDNLVIILKIWLKIGYLFL